MKSHHWVSVWISMWLITVIAIFAIAILNRTVFPAPIIQGMSAYKHDGHMVYEIRTYHGYHKLTKDKYEKYKVGDKYE